MKLIYSLVAACLIGCFSLSAQEAGTAEVKPKKPDTVILKSGAKVKGYLVDQTPGESVTYRQEDGTAIVIPIKDIKRTKRNVDRGYSLQYQHTGWKGLAGVQFTISTFKRNGLGSLTKPADHVSVYGIGGYQFCPEFFAGAGAQLNWFYAGHAFKDDPFCTFPIFADLRLTPIKHRFSPLVDVRLGGFVGKMQGFYGSFGGGVRVAINDNSGMNVTVGYTLQNPKKMSGINHDYVTAFGSYGNLNGVTINIGFDF